MTEAEIRNHVWTDGVATYIWNDSYGWVEIIDDHTVVSEYRVITDVLAGRLRVKDEEV